MLNRTESIKKVFFSFRLNYCFMFTCYLSRLLCAIKCTILITVQDLCYNYFIFQNIVVYNDKMQENLLKTVIYIYIIISLSLYIYIYRPHTFYCSMTNASGPISIFSSLSYSCVEIILFQIKLNTLQNKNVYGLILFLYHLSSV